jgi:lambda repressor-like predicted transcriptional regulator
MKKRLIGNLIKEKLKENDRSIAWLAKKTGYTRSNIYKALKLKYIHSELIDRISEALEYDFFTFYSESIHKDENERRNT